MLPKTHLKEIEKISAEEVAGNRRCREANLELMRAEFWVRQEDTVKPSTIASSRVPANVANVWAGPESRSSPSASSNFPANDGARRAGIQVAADMHGSVL